MFLGWFSGFHVNYLHLALTINNHGTILRQNACKNFQCGLFLVLSEVLHS